MSEKELEAELTLKDRLNFPYLLANQILTFQKAILNLEFSEREIREAIESFVHLIPEDWKDQKFEDEIKKAKTVKKTDVRPVVAGGIRMSEETCKELEIPDYKEEEVFDYYKMFQACINLLNRRKMLSKVNPVEQIDFIELEHIAETEASEVG